MVLGTHRHDSTGIWRARRKGLRAPHRRSVAGPRRRSTAPDGEEHGFSSLLIFRRGGFYGIVPRIDSLQLLNLQMRSPLLRCSCRAFCLPFSQQSRRPSLFIALATAIASAGFSAPSAQAASRIHYADSGCSERSDLPGCVKKTFNTSLQPYTAKSYPDHGLDDPMSEAGRKARGLYITPMYLFGMGAERTAAAVSKAHLNAVSST